MKPTDPVAAPLLPAFLCNIASRVLWLRQALDKGEIPAEMKGKLARFTASLPFETDLLSGKMEQVQRAIDGLAAQDAASNAPLPPRADWALEAARWLQRLETLAQLSGYVLRGERLVASMDEIIEAHAKPFTPQEEAKAVLEALSHVPAAPDAQDGERLDAVEKHKWEFRWQPVSKYWRGHNVNAEGPTLRAALDQARGQKG